MDVLIFVAVVAAVPLLGGGLAARTAAYGVFLAVGLLKFYPLVLLGLLVRETPRVALGLGVAVLAVVAVAVLPMAGEYGRAIANILPTPAFTGTFGGRHLALGLAQLWPGHGVAAALVGVLVALVAVVVAVRVAADAAMVAAMNALPRRHADLCLVGAMLTLGCFLAGESVEYRAIFLVLAMPALLRLGGRIRLFMVSAGIVAWLLWDPLVRRVVAWLAPGGEVPSVPGLVVWAVRELLWWWVAAVLAGLIVGLLHRAPLLVEARGRLGFR